ncbi:MAG: NUDIX domain-containing protein [Candidatus Pacearchaeota archaeon]
MKTRKGIVAIIFVRNKEKKYLLLRRKMYWIGWEWLKGGRKKGEKEIECLKREIKEETGKNVEEYIVKKTNYIFSFKYERPFVHDKELWRGAKNRVYLVEFNNKKIKLDKDEHSSFRWVTRKKALKMITWDDQRKVFEKLTKNL